MNNTPCIPSRPTPPAPAAQPRICADLRQLLDGAVLLKMTLEVAQSLAIRPGAQLPGSPNPRMMLTLLTFCYATARYGSDEVAEAAWADPAVRYITARETVTAQDVRRFRSRNALWIEHCLTRLLGRVWQSAMPESTADGHSGGSPHGAILSAALHSARRRLDWAMQLDAVE